MYCSAKILDSETGEYVRVEKLYSKQNLSIYSLNEDNLRLIKNRIDISLSKETRPVYKIITRYGREINLSLNYSLYTIEGFRQLNSLEPGDFIAIAKGMMHSNQKQLDNNDIKFLAYMIGDGNCTRGSTIRFSCSIENLKILTEMNRIVSKYDCELSQYESNKTCDYHIVNREKISKAKLQNKAKTKLTEYEVYGKGAHNKVIPNEIFKLSNDQLKIFISRLYATDGWATSSQRDKNRCEIGYCSISKELLVGIQSLLLRFNINANLRRKKVPYKDKVNIAYTLDIFNRDGLLKFCNDIGIYSKEKSINKLYDIAYSMIDHGSKIDIKVLNYIEKSISEKGIAKQELRNNALRINYNYKSIRDTKIKKANAYIKDDKLVKYYDNDLIWDEIKEIKYIGDVEVYNLDNTIYHNFIVNDFVICK